MPDQVTTQAPASPTQPTSGVFESLVGPDKKFASPEDLAKGKLEGDAFILKVTDENKELRKIVEDLNRKVELATARASITNQPTLQPDGSGQPASGTSPTAPVQPTAAGLSAEDVRKLIEESKQQEQASENIRRIDSTLNKVLGSDAGAFVKQKATELGLSASELYRLAAQSPQAVLNMLGINPNTSQSTGSMYVAKGGGAVPGVNNGPVRNKKYYDTLRKEMGHVKFATDAKLQLGMHKDAQALGDDFYN
jgi:hypothetical protein